MDPYWRARALLYMFSENPLGEKEELLERIDKFLFDNYLFKRSGDEELRETSDIEIETIIKSANVAFEDEDKALYEAWNEKIRAGTPF